MRAGGHAQIGESLSLEYSSRQIPCNTIHTVGRVFSRTGYGIALTKNSPYKEELSTLVLQLRESGYFEELFQKW